MAIKLKRLISNNCIAKYIALVVMFLSLSIGFEACFNLKYNFTPDFRHDFLPKFYLFGNVYPHLTSDLLDDYILIALGCALIFLISLSFYKINRNTYSKFEIKIISFSSKFPIEIPIFFILALLLVRFNIWSTTMPFYDEDLVSCNFFLLGLTYFYFETTKLNNYDIKSKSFLYCFLDRHSKESLNKKIAFILTFITIVQIIFFIFILNFCSYPYSTGFIFYSISTILFYLFIYKLLSHKFNYIDSIAINIKNIENGDLNYKLDVIGNDEMSALATSINNITNGLETALENQVKSEKMKSELLTNVSHDLKTPLTSIVNYVDILKNNDLDKDTMKDYINILDKKSKRLKTLIEDIFEASKINSGDIELDFEKTDIKELLIQSIVELEDKIDESSLDFIIETPDDSVFTFIDGKKTWRVFENLIGNILKYSLSNTRVYIDMFDEDDKVIIVFKNISNHKLNIKPQDLIERFRRGDVSRNTDGSGLGLSIAQSIVDLQHGDMKIDIDGDLFKATLTFDKFLECVL